MSTSHSAGGALHTWVCGSRALTSKLQCPSASPEYLDAGCRIARIPSGRGLAEEREPAFERRVVEVLENENATSLPTCAAVDALRS